MAPTNKSLAQMNKSPDEGRATNKRAANRGARWSLHWLGHAAEYINVDL